MALELVSSRHSELLTRMQRTAVDTPGSETPPFTVLRVQAFGGDVNYEGENYNGDNNTKDNNTRYCTRRYIKTVLYVPILSQRFNYHENLLLKLRLK